MTLLSKFFEEQIAPRTCQEILHTGTCREHLKKDILLYTLSNFKYFVPICLIPALIKIGNMNKRKLRKTLEYYLACSVIGTTMGLSINALMCLFRNIYGRFAYYSFIFIPALLGALPLYLGPARVINLFETTVFQCTIETFFVMRKNILSRTIASSKILQTCLFMTSSAIILHVKRVYNAQAFWLLKPNRKVHLPVNSEQFSKCHLHPESSCKQYVIDGIRKYFILGLSLDSIKMLVRHVNSKQNQSKLLNNLKGFRLRSMALFTAYVGIYRFVHCWLNRKGFYSDDWNHIFASFLSGCCYYLYPQQTLFAYALVQAVYSFCKILEVTSMNGQYKILQLILSIPYTKILFPLALANVLHLNALKSKYTTNLTAAIANGLTNKQHSRVQNKIDLLKAQFTF